MASEIFRYAVHDHVRAEVERVLKHGRCEGVVHHNPRRRVFHHFRHSGDVGDLHHRVGRGFDPDHLRVLIQCGPERIEVSQIHKMKRDAVMRKNRGEQSVTAAIEIVG